VLTLAGAYGLMQILKRRSKVPHPSKQSPPERLPTSKPFPKKQPAQQQSPKQPKQPPKPRKPESSHSSAARAFSQLEKETMQRAPKDVVLPPNAQQDQDELDLEMRILKVQLGSDDRSQYSPKPDEP